MSLTARGIGPLELGTVAAGGVLGAEARLGVMELLPRSAPDFPWWTLVVNTSGCLLAGAVVTVLVVRTTNPLARLFLAVGVLGGYTTFSGYAVDAVDLVDAGRPLAAASYAVATLALAVAAVLLGVALAHALVGRGGPATDPDDQT